MRLAVGGACPWKFGAVMSDLRTLAENATPGPWTVEEPRPRYITTNCEHIDIDEADWGEEVGNGFQVVTVLDHRAWRYADVRYIAACSPDVILGLLGELDRLRAIVNDLAARMPEVARDCYYYVCGCCREESTSNIVHDESCPYRRAVEYKEGQP